MFKKIYVGYFIFLITNDFTCSAIDTAVFSSSNDIILEIQIGRYMPLTSI
ncbi:MAG: hypothetical protein ACYCTB_11600 [bacterium]